MTEPTVPPRPVEEGKLVYLKLSELHPFHTFRPHPFKVRDDAKMQETVASIKFNGVTPYFSAYYIRDCRYRISCVILLLMRDRAPFWVCCVW